MKYRKIIWILGAAVVLAGCSADDDGVNPVVPVDGDVAIAFKANVKEMQNVTRATGVINEPADMADNGFGVFCLYTNGNKYADLFRNENNTPVASTDTTTIMNNFRVYSPDGGASWTYGQTRYWPVDQLLSFFTYAPYIATNTATTDVTEDSPMRVMYNDNKAFSGKIQFYESNDPAKQHDILYGTTSDGNALTDWKSSKRETDTEVTTGSGDKLTKTGGITSYFRHSTAKLKMFINHNFDKVESSNQRIYITSVELKNVPQKGELDITKSNITTTTTGETSTTSITPAWSNISGNQNIVLTDNNLNSAIAYTGSFDVQGVTTNTNAVLPTSDDYLLLLPKDNSQTLTDGKLPDGTEPMEIVITYIPISKNMNGQYITGPAVTVNKTLTNKFEGNKSYTLNITLGANTTITLVTQPWEENDIPQNGNESKMFDIPADGFINWTYNVVNEDADGNPVTSSEGYSYSSITTDGIVVTEPYYGDRTECSFQINTVSEKDITCKAELLECSSDGRTLTGNPSKAFTFEDNNTSMVITPDSKSTLRIKYNGDSKTAAYARLRIIVTYGGKEYIVYSLTGEKTYTEYTLYHIAVDNSTEGQ